MLFRGTQTECCIDATLFLSVFLHSTQVWYSTWFIRYLHPTNFLMEQSAIEGANNWNSLGTEINNSSGQHADCSVQTTKPAVPAALPGASPLKPNTCNTKYLLCTATTTMSRIPLFWRMNRNYTHYTYDLSNTLIDVGVRVLQQVRVRAVRRHVLGHVYLTLGVLRGARVVTQFAAR
jgi:hypothetical protein